MTVFLECKPDESLARALGVARGSIVHSHSKGRVARDLARNSGVIGMVDEDFAQAEPPTLRKYRRVSLQHDVECRELSSRGNRLVVLRPRLEPWLLRAAREAGREMADFGLPDRLPDLDACINHRLENVDRLVRELLAAANPRLTCLRSLLLG